ELGAGPESPRLQHREQTEQSSGGFQHPRSLQKNQDRSCPQCGPATKVGTIGCPRGNQRCSPNVCFRRGGKVCRSSVEPSCHPPCWPRWAIGWWASLSAPIPRSCPYAIIGGAIVGLGEHHALAPLADQFAIKLSLDATGAEPAPMWGMAAVGCLTMFVLGVERLRERRTWLAR